MSKPNNNNNSAPPRKTHSTITGSFVSLNIHVILLLLLAWFCLLLWFTGVSLWKGGNAGFAQANELVSYYQAPLANATDGWGLWSTISPDVLIQRNLIQTHALDMLNILAQKFTTQVYSVPVMCSNYPAYLPVALLFTVTKLILMRFFLFLFSLPLLLWCLLPGAIDGLVNRDIRKFQAMRESTFLFHRLKRLLPLVFFVPVFIFFVCPLAIPAIALFLPMALTIGVIILFTVQNFKKYL